MGGIFFPRVCLFAILLPVCGCMPMRTGIGIWDLQKGHVVNVSTEHADLPDREAVLAVDPSNEKFYTVVNGYTHPHVIRTRDIETGRISAMREFRLGYDWRHDIGNNCVLSLESKHFYGTGASNPKSRGVFTVDLDGACNNLCGSGSPVFAGYGYVHELGILEKDTLVANCAENHPDNKIHAPVSRIFLIPPPPAEPRLIYTGKLCEFSSLSTCGRYFVFTDDGSLIVYDAKTDTVDIVKKYDNLADIGGVDVQQKRGLIVTAYKGTSKNNDSLDLYDISTRQCVKRIAWRTEIHSDREICTPFFIGDNFIGGVLVPSGDIVIYNLDTEKLVARRKVNLLGNPKPSPSGRYIIFEHAYFGWFRK